MGADPIVAGILMESERQGEPLNGFLIRKEAKAHGMQRWVEGPDIPDNAKVVIVEDVITSGGSAIRAIEAMRKQYNPEVVRVLAIVDRQAGGKEKLNEAGFEFEALFTRADFGR